MSRASPAPPQKRPSPPRPVAVVQRPQPQPAQPVRPRIDPAVQGLVNVIATLEAVVEEETAALATRSPIDLDAFSNRKSQGFLELNRTSRALAGVTDQKIVATRLGSLREKLAANQAALKLHLEAIREISSIVANAIREQESDGTYSQSIRSPNAGYGYD